MMDAARLAEIRERLGRVQNGPLSVDLPGMLARYAADVGDLLAALDARAAVTVHDDAEADLRPVVKLPIGSTIGLTADADGKLPVVVEAETSRPVQWIDGEPCAPTPFVHLRGACLESALEAAFYGKTILTDDASAATCPACRTKLRFNMPTPILPSVGVVSDPSPPTPLIMEYQEPLILTDPDDDPPDADATPLEPRTCQCSTTDLMRQGCRCGAMQ